MRRGQLTCGGQDVDVVQSVVINLCYDIRPNALEAHLRKVIQVQAIEVERLPRDTSDQFDHPYKLSMSTAANLTQVLRAAEELETSIADAYKAQDILNWMMVDEPSAE